MNLTRAALILLVGGALLAPQPAAAWTYMSHYSGGSGRYMSHYSRGGNRLPFSFYQRGRSSGGHINLHGRGVTAYRVPAVRSVTYRVPFWMRSAPAPICGNYNRMPEGCKFVTTRYEPEVASTE